MKVTGVEGYCVPPGHPAHKDSPGASIGIMIQGLDLEDIKARLAAGEKLYVLGRAK